MREYWNNKGRIIFLSGLFALCSSLLLALCLILPDRASPGPYLDSAHGNTTYGVKRSATGFPTDYAKGNCAHCHEQHASIGGTEPAPTGGPSKWCLLATNFSGKTTKTYAQSDSVCFYCHIVTGAYQSPVFYNYSYSITFGGNPDITPNNIFDTFNSTSYHNLYDVYRLITGLTGTKTFTSFPADSNPCSGCHNVHIAKRSCGKPTGSYDPTKSAISRPSDHSNLWGDDASERLKPNFTTNYRAPYWYGSTNYEPNNSTTYDGTNLPDYNTFCTDCHNATNTIYSTTLGRNLKKINWVTTGGETGGDKHGKNVATATAAGNIHLKNPYLGVWTAAGLVLACTDCHEPHGSPNVFLLRNEINGGVLSNSITAFDPNICSQYVYSGCKVYSTDGNKMLGSLCNRCHKDDYDLDPGNYPTPNTWKYVHHYGTDFPYERTRCYRCHWDNTLGGPISCNCCHYHGASTTDYGTDYPCICDPIPCDLNPPIDRKTF